MLIGLVIAIGIPALVLIIYAIGRSMYGEKWYRILGASAIDDKLREEIEEARIIKLNLK
jgi:hypothetical protein